jgi:YidC/Oxa1 family membrane protein insertase
MDRKSIIVLAVCFALLLLWSSVIVPKLYPPKRLPPGATNAVVSTQMVARMTVSNPAEVQRQLEAAVPENATTPKLPVDTNVPEQLLVVTNTKARYTFTSYGGGLKLVELTDYPESVASWQGKKSGTNRLATLDTQAPVPTLAVLDGEAVQSDGIFHLTRTATGVRADKNLANGLTLVKDFSPGTNYLLTATVRLENQSSNTLSLPSQEWVLGTATPMNAQDGSQALGMMWYNGQKTEDMMGASYFSSRGLACVPRIPPAEYRAGQTNVVWAAVHNQFFALAVMPQEPALEVVVRKVNLPRPSPEEAQFVAPNAPAPVGYEAALTYPALTLSPGEVAQRQFVLYAGPKEYRTLARIAAFLNNHLDSIMGFGTFWGFFSKALLLGMNGLHRALGISYGWTIVAITVIIKAVFWPLTAASTRSMKRMQALQPKIKEIKEKYKDDAMKVQRKTMELFKEHKVNPMGGCFPMLIQMPVFIGFYTMIRNAIELRGASFLWISDLSQRDTLFIIPGLGLVPFIGVPGVGLPFNLLPLLMGATMLWQSHLTPMSPGVDPVQQKLMRYMPLMFLLFLYNYSAGMTLYWTVNNLLTILQTKLTRARQAAPPAPVLTPPAKRRK